MKPQTSNAIFVKQSYTVETVEYVCGHNYDNDVAVNFQQPPPAPPPVADIKPTLSDLDTSEDVKRCQPCGVNFADAKVR